jgi:hypothetical protein
MSEPIAEGADVPDDEFAASAHPIHVTLTGPHIASGGGVTVTSESPLLTLVCELLDAGIPPLTPMQVYRDGALVAETTVGGVITND